MKFLEGPISDILDSLGVEHSSVETAENGMTVILEDPLPAAVVFRRIQEDPRYDKVFRPGSGGAYLFFENFQVPRYPVLVDFAIRFTTGKGLIQNISGAMKAARVYSERGIIPCFSPKSVAEALDQETRDEVLQKEVASADI